MSGHSKWSQIKRKKGATDVKRGQLFSQLVRQLTVAARLGENLEIALAAARSANIPKETIDRAIAKGTGQLDGTEVSPALYEIYGPGGAGILVETLTDNTNRTLGELRAVLNKLGGTLAQVGSVQFLFDRRAVISVRIGSDPEFTQLMLIEAGIDDLSIQDDRIIGYGLPNRFIALQRKLEASGLELLDAQLAWVPKITLPTDATTRDKLIRLIEMLTKLADVGSVETNVDLR